MVSDIGEEIFGIMKYSRARILTGIMWERGGKNLLAETRLKPWNCFLSFMWFEEEDQAHQIQYNWNSERDHTRNAYPPPPAKLGYLRLQITCVMVISSEHISAVAWRRVHTSSRCYISLVICTTRTIEIRPFHHGKSLVDISLNHVILELTKFPGCHWNWLVVYYGLW